MLSMHSTFFAFRYRTFLDLSCAALPKIATCSKHIVISNQNGFAVFMMYIMRSVLEDHHAIIVVLVLVVVVMVVVVMVVVV